MDQMEIRQLVARQRAYFQSGATLPARARVEALRALRSAVAAREEELNDASGPTWARAPLRAICARWAWSSVS